MLAPNRRVEFIETLSKGVGRTGETDSALFTATRLLLVFLNNCLVMKEKVGRSLHLSFLMQPPVL